MWNKKSNNAAWWKDELPSYTYVGWRGLGPIFGTRYYLYIGDNVVKMLGRSPLRRIILHTFPASAILCTDAKRPSMTYALFGAIVGFFGDLFTNPVTMRDNIDVMNSQGFGGLLEFLLSSFVFAVVLGTVLDRLFERPRINFILEGGTHIGTFTNFKKRLPEVIQLISKARGINSSESMRSKHRYFIFQARAM